MAGLTSNEYFTYFWDDASNSYHRSADQIWNVTQGGVTYNIRVSGTIHRPGFPDGQQYVSFAKKHLLTSVGGKAYSKALQIGGSEGANPRAKAERVLAHRHRARTNNDAVREEYLESRQNKWYRMDETNQRQYQVDALGGAKTDLNTVVICDYIDPQELRDAFARGLHEKRPWTAGDEKHNVKVEFKLNKTSKTSCIISNSRDGKVTEDGNTLLVTAYCVSAAGKNVECAIVHLDGTA